MKFDDLYGKVPEEMHNKLSETLMELPESGEYAKTTHGVPLRRYTTIKRAAMIAAAAALLMVLTVTAFANSEFIRSLFQREQELVDPYSVILNKQDQKDGVTLTIEKIAEDDYLIYVYYKLHSEKPFEKGWLLYEDIDLRVENEENPETSAQMACVDVGGTNVRRALLVGTYLVEIEEPTCDVEGVLEMRKTMNASTIKTVGGRKIYHPEYVEWRSGKYHFTVEGLSVGRWVPDENGEIDEMKSEVEQFKYTDKLHIAFDFNKNCLEKMPSKVWHPDTEFELEGCTFKVMEIKQTAMNLWITITSESDKVIEIEDQHFNPIAIFMSFNYSTEFNIYDPHTDDEVQAFHEFYKDHELWKRSYNIGVKMNADLPEQRFWEKRYEFKEGGFDDDAMKMRIRFDVPVYTNEIKELYVHDLIKWHTREGHPEEETELTIWKNE